jgi:hypothetical protein
MNQWIALKPALLSAALACALSSPATAIGILTNPGFESGLSGWTVANQLGSDGAFQLQSGTLSPVNAVPVPAPPGGTFAAMTDAQGPGSHVLYQNFSVTAPVASAMLNFDVFIGNRAAAFSVPNTLDFSTPVLNQQARVDILLAAADKFSVASADVLLNVYQTQVGDPLVSGYTHVSVDLTSVLNSNVNTLLTLRFAEVDNVNIFQMGVDNADIDIPGADVPEPSFGGLLLGIGSILILRRAWKVRRTGLQGTL